MEQKKKSTYSLGDFRHLGFCLELVGDYVS